MNAKDAEEEPAKGAEGKPASSGERILVETKGRNRCKIR
jgi:hypothetical protein